MSCVRKYGKPDLFITMTCNPEWPEILIELKPHQKPNDRPDLIAKIFYLKLKELIVDIKEKQIFGRVIAFTHVIEFQKRGLPHAHILIILGSEAKFNTITDYDYCINAELPNAQINPQAYKTVTKCLLHGPCGPEYPNSPCMIDGKCSKNFPKPYCQSTRVNDNG